MGEFLFFLVCHITFKSIENTNKPPPKEKDWYKKYYPENSMCLNADDFEKWHGTGGLAEQKRKEREQRKKEREERNKH